MIHDIAESVSRNDESADLYLKEEGVDVESYVSKGLDKIEALLKKKSQKKIKVKSSGKGANLYFKRAVLAAEIASNLHNERTFGHVKFQKLVYLGEQICELKADKEYSKQVAGPYDRKFMHSIDFQFKRQKWFEVKLEKIQNFKMYKYYPLENIDNYKQYYERYYSDNDKDIKWLINTFKKKKTDDVELIATLFYCWKEIKNEFSEDLLIERFYQWSKEKKKFSRVKVTEGITWMKENNFYPTIYMD